MSEPTFTGFIPPMQNFFKMPNTWTDITAEIESLAELKIVEYVLRHTWGYHEFGLCKTISIDEFMHGRKHVDGSRMDKGTGLKSDRSVRDGIKLAIEHGYLICEVDSSDQARVKKSYALKMNDGDLPAKPVDTTRVVDTTRGRYHQSAPTILPVGAVDTTSRSEKETLERHLKKERETPNIRATETASPSLSPSSKKLSSEEPTTHPAASLEEKLTDVQADFWSRWCAIAGATTLNETALGHVTSLAPHVSSTQALQSLYDLSYTRLRELAQVAGKEAVPPRLGNLVKCLPEWEQAQKRREQEQAEEHKTREHIPGTGHLTNYTAQRLKGEAVPPLTYTRLPQTPNKRNSGLSKLEIGELMPVRKGLQLVKS